MIAGRSAKQSDAHDRAVFEIKRTADFRQQAVLKGGPTGGLERRGLEIDLGIRSDRLAGAPLAERISRAQDRVTPQQDLK